jgi:hypothetical protein
MLFTFKRLDRSQNRQMPSTFKLPESPARRQWLAGASALYITAGVATVLAATKDERPRKVTLAWFDIDVPSARANYSSMTTQLFREAEALSCELAITPYFWERHQPARNLEALLEQALLTEPDAFACLSHHVALALQAKAPTSNMLLVTVLDPHEVGVQMNGHVAGISFDNPGSQMALDLLSQMSQAGARIGVAAASEWLTSGRLQHIKKTAAVLGLDITLINADNRESLLQNDHWKFRLGFDGWWIPESLLLFDNREYLVESIAVSAKPHVFGRRVSAEKGAMLALQPHVVDWQSWFSEYILALCRGVRIQDMPLTTIRDWHCFGNAETIAALSPPLPQFVLDRIDSFV